MCRSYCGSLQVAWCTPGRAFSGSVALESVCACGARFPYVRGGGGSETRGGMVMGVDHTLWCCWWHARLARRVQPEGEWPWGWTTPCGAVGGTRGVRGAASVVRLQWCCWLWFVLKRVCAGAARACLRGVCRCTSCGGGSRWRSGRATPGCPLGWSCPSRWRWRCSTCAACGCCWRRGQTPTPSSSRCVARGGGPDMACARCVRLARTLCHPVIGWAPACKGGRSLWVRVCAGVPAPDVCACAGAAHGVRGAASVVRLQWC